MINISDLDKRVSEIEKRNFRVELDKAWETSWVRRGLLILFTYLSVGFYMHAIIPSLGFLLSTLTLPFFKNLWTRYRQ
jgi:hypothetical protein